MTRRLRHVLIVIASIVLQGEASSRLPCFFMEKSRKMEKLDDLGFLAFGRLP